MDNFESPEYEEILAEDLNETLDRLKTFHTVDNCLVVLTRKPDGDSVERIFTIKGIKLGPDGDCIIIEVF